MLAVTDHALCLIKSPGRYREQGRGIVFRKIANGWELIKASWRVLRADKELIIFPIVSAVGVLFVTITFALPMFLQIFSTHSWWVRRRSSVP